jgi:hypothetical protein
VSAVGAKEQWALANKNYQKGVRFERERLKHYAAMGRCALRTAGSHGAFDIVVVDDAHGICSLIQCKVTSDHRTAERLLAAFRDNPPLKRMKGIHQTMEVKVTGSMEVHSVTV